MEQRGWYEPPPGGFGPPGPPFEPPAPRYCPQALASFTLGVLTLPSCCCSVLAWPLAIAAVVLGLVALDHVRRDPREWKGGGLAVAGIVAACVGLLVQLVGFFLLFDNGMCTRYLGSFF